MNDAIMIVCVLCGLVVAVVLLSYVMDNVMDNVMDKQGVVYKCECLQDEENCYRYMRGFLGSTNKLKVDCELAVVDFKKIDCIKEQCGIYNKTTGEFIS